jgi:hypothetical protein
MNFKVYIIADWNQSKDGYFLVPRDEKEDITHRCVVDSFGSVFSLETNPEYSTYKLTKLNPDTVEIKYTF